MPDRAFTDLASSSPAKVPLRWRCDTVRVFAEPFESKAERCGKLSSKFSRCARFNFFRREAQLAPVCQVQEEQSAMINIYSIIYRTESISSLVVCSKRKSASIR